MIEGLKGKADEESGNRDGKVTLGELASYTSTEVYKFVDRTRNDEQLPEYLFKANSINLVDLGGKQSRSFTNSLGMKFTLIKAGEFLMGSPDTDKDAGDDEKPQHRVRITRPFYLGVHEVTRGQFRRFVDDSGYQTEAEKDGKGGWGWNEAANKFEQKPSLHLARARLRADRRAPGGQRELERRRGLRRVAGEEGGQDLPAAHRGRVGICLPCRHDHAVFLRRRRGGPGRGRKRRGRDGPGKVSRLDGHYRGRDGFVYTAPVGRYRPNAWGLHDMHGNVWEWCWDWYGKDFYKGSRVDDPAGPLEAASRVIRGGSWYHDPRNCRSAGRGRCTPDHRNSDLGFRLALVQ